MLRRELGVEPSATTEQLHLRLLRMQEQLLAGQEVHQEAQTPRPVQVPLVGRQKERQQLRQVWHSLAQTVAQSEAHFILIAGEAGMGKSHLAEELYHWTRNQGFAALYSRSYEAEGDLAYAPIVDWLRSPSLHSVLQEAEEVWLLEVARLLPEILQDRPHLPQLQPLTEGWQRRRLFEALARLFHRYSDPLLLIIDDLQWCDQGTLEWLHFLLRFDPKAPILMVGTVRPEEITPEHPLNLLIRNLQRSNQLLELVLTPLSEVETVALAHQVAERELDAETTTGLYAETEGNPLFVVETVRARLWDQRQNGGAQSELTSPRTQSPGQQALPPKIFTVIESRLLQLSAPARELTELAAVIGRSFTYEVLAQASDQDENSLVHGLEELWRRRIIREQGTEAYDFSHDKLREVVYGGTSQARQHLLHRRVAQALETVYAQDLDSASAQIAVHYERSSRLRQAIDYYQKAAHMAQRVYAHEQAIAHYTRAIELNRHLTQPLQAAQILLLYEKRSRVWSAISQYDKAIADLKIVRELAREAGDLKLEGETLCNLARTHWMTFDRKLAPLAEHYARAAMAIFEQTDDEHILARSLTMLAAADQAQRDLPQAGRKLEKALQIGRRPGYEDSLTETFDIFCLQAHLQGNFPRVMQVGQEGMTLARKLNAGFSELNLLGFLCQAYWSSGQYAQAFALVGDGMKMAEERGNPFTTARLLNTLGWFHRELGDVARAVELDQESAELGREAAIAHVELSALVNLGYDYLGLGHYDRARACLESTLDRVQHEAFGAHRWRWQMKLFIGLGEHAYHTGDYAKALHYVGRGLEEAEATASQKYIAIGRGLCGKILTSVGDVDAASIELQRAFATVEQVGSPSLAYPIAYELGRWHESIGMEQEAAAWYGKANISIAQMAAAIEDDSLRLGFFRSTPVQLLSESLARVT